LKKVELFTDGAGTGNPGPGGWGAILKYGNIEKELCGGELNTTNNRMELTAAIEGLKALKEPCAVTLYSDSKYLVDAINLGWAKGWEQNGWRKADKKPALNIDLWQEILRLFEKHTVTLVWLKGHAGHPYNERCDKLAVSYYQGLQK